MEPFTTPNKLLNHMRNLYIDTRQDTTHGQVTYIVGSLKFIGLIHIAETITNRFSQFETKPIFNSFLSGVKTNFELNSKDHQRSFQHLHDILVVAMRRQCLKSIILFEKINKH